MPDATPKPTLNRLIMSCIDSDGAAGNPRHGRAVIANLIACTPASEGPLDFPRWARDLMQADGDGRITELKLEYAVRGLYPSPELQAFIDVTDN